MEIMLNDICGPDLFTSIYDTLSVNLFSSGGKYSAVLSVIRSLYNIALPIGIMLMFIYFMLALVDKLSSESFTWEHLWRQLAMLLAAKYLMEHGFELLELLFGIGMAAMSKISVVSGADVSAAAIDAEAMISGFRDSLGGWNIPIIRDVIMFVYLLIPWALSWLMRLCVSIICYSRVIEIYVRAAFAPVALSDFFHSGLQGGGWKYLKNFLAVSLQGAIILVIAIIYSRLFQSITIDDDGNFFRFIGAYLAFYASAVMLMFKSLPLAKDLVGTN